MDVLDYGRMAFVVDPTGAAIGLWQSGANVGAGIVNEHGALSWNELETRDPEAAKAFYAAVFGWSFEDHEMPGMGTYTEWKLGDAAIGGMADISRRVPDEVPAHWMVYFAVDDTDAAVEQIGAGGGEVRFGPVDSPAGRFAMAADPWGAVFAVIALSADAQEVA
jgi:predicted enzyme related to lactoylglutathione lyase